MNSKAKKYILQLMRTDLLGLGVRAELAKDQTEDLIQRIMKCHPYKSDSYETAITKEENEAIIREIINYNPFVNDGEGRTWFTEAERSLRDFMYGVLRVSIIKGTPFPLHSCAANWLEETTLREIEYKCLSHKYLKEELKQA